MLGRARGPAVRTAGDPSAHFSHSGGQDSVVKNQRGSQMGSPVPLGRHSFVVSELGRVWGEKREIHSSLLGDRLLNWSPPSPICKLTVD